MIFRIEFGVVETYMLYAGTVLTAIFFASVSNKVLITKKGRKLPLDGFLKVAFIILAIPLIFRETGVDNQGYRNIYNEIASWNGNMLQNYRGFPEPLFMFVNYVISALFDNFQLVYIISGIISLFFTYKAFNTKIEEIHPGIILGLFSFTFYFYMYGLVRLVIAVSVITYALKFLERQRNISFIFWGIIAGMFHYSALLIIPIFILISSISINNTNQFKFYKSIAVSTIITPSVFILGMNIFQMLFNRFTWFNRYSKYFNMNKVSILIIKNVVWIVPLLIILIVYGKYIEKKMSYFKLHANLVFVMMSIAVLSVFFGVQRLIYYMYPSAFYLYASVLELPYKTEEQKKIKMFYWLGIIIMGLIWMFFVVIGGDNWKRFMIPYSFYIN